MKKLDYGKDLGDTLGGLWRSNISKSEAIHKFPALSSSIAFNEQPTKIGTSKLKSNRKNIYKDY